MCDFFYFRLSRLTFNWFTSKIFNFVIKVCILPLEVNYVSNVHFY